MVATDICGIYLFHTATAVAMVRTTEGMLQVGRRALAIDRLAHGRGHGTCPLFWQHALPMASNRIARHPR